MKLKFAKLVMTICALALVAVGAFGGVVFKASAGMDSVDVLTSNEYTRYLSSDMDVVKTVSVKTAPMTDAVEIYANSSYNKTAELYKDGENKVVASDLLNLSCSSKSNMVNAKLKVTLYKEGSYEFTVSGEDKDDKAVSEVFTIVAKGSVEFPKVTYKDETEFASLYEAYKEEVVKNSFIDGKVSEGKYIYLGDKYTVPSMECLLNTSLLDYKQFKKTVYYATPGYDNWTVTSVSINSTTSPSFNVSSLGVYKFYMLLESDYDGVGIAYDNLEERSDGLYTIYKAGMEEKLFVKVYNDSTVKYFEDEDYEVEYTESVDAVKTVPIFSFEIKSTEGPKVKCTSTTQEKGYIDLKYTVSSLSVSGGTPEYFLEYSSNGTDWADATEKLNTSSTPYFTPSRKGYYRVKVVATDSYGNTAEAVTSNIEVKDKYVSIKYKTSFSDWLEVNTVPFIFFCISGVLAIAIICIIFIKPKDNSSGVVKAEEEDK